MSTPGRRRLRLSWAPLIAIATLGGCGRRSPAPEPPKAGPHGGQAIAIPGGAGFAEARLERPPGGQADGQDRPVLAIYFLGRDARTAMEPPPADVEVKLGQRDTTSRSYVTSYRLTHRPLADDPAGAARFVSEPGKFGGERVTGRVTATIGGAEASFPLVVPVEAPRPKADAPAK
jgi:hypothetical protein